MSEDIQKFFDALSERAYKENNLSDVTYALCQASQVFKQFFLDFFFGADVIDASKADIEREYSFEQGRPDFVINTPNGMFLIEAKIWDGNHHFDQYRSILEGKTGHLAYIANYEIKYSDLSPADQSAYKDICCGKKSVKTWKEFIDRLEKYECLNDSLIQGYVSYVKKVCSFDDFTANIDSKIDINDFKKIKDIYGYITQAIEKTDGISLYTRSSRDFISQFRMGRFFEWNFEEEQVWGWYGICYRTEGAVIVIEFENRNGWGNLVCDRCKDKLSLENNCLHFYFCGEIVSAEAITHFLQQVLQAISNNSANKDTFADRRDDKRIVLFKDLLIMKQLPYLLENFFYKIDLSKLGYEIMPEYYSDQERPAGHCGRYFKLTKFSDNEHCDNLCNPVVGWFGAVYDNESIIASNTYAINFNETPQFVLELDREWVNARLCNNTLGAYDDEWGWKCFNIAKDEVQKGEITFEKLRDGVESILQVLLSSHSDSQNLSLEMSK